MNTVAKNKPSIKKLKKYLHKNLKELTRDKFEDLNHNKSDSKFKNFFDKNTGYEKDLIQILTEFECNNCRYWDLVWNKNNKKYYIEVKKGESIWLDLVRYSEILNKKPNHNTRLHKGTARKTVEDNYNKTITLFLIPDKEKKSIEKFYIIETDDLIKFIFSNENAKEYAKHLLSLYKIFPSLNAQIRININDLDQLIY